MRIRFVALALLLLTAGLILAGYWLRQRQSAARRLEEWHTQEADDAARANLDRSVLLAGQPLTLHQFAELLRLSSGLPVRIDEQAIHTVTPAASLSIPKGNFSIQSAIRIVQEPSGLCADVRGGSLVITTPEHSTGKNELRTVVYPPPQPEPAGMDERDWSQLVTTNVEPQTWDSAGGGSGPRSLPPYCFWSPSGPIRLAASSAASGMSPRVSSSTFAL